MPDKSSASGETVMDCRGFMVFFAIFAVLVNKSGRGIVVLVAVSSTLFVVVWASAYIPTPRTIHATETITIIVKLTHNFDSELCME